MPGGLSNTASLFDSLNQTASRFIGEIGRGNLLPFSLTLEFWPAFYIRPHDHPLCLLVIVIKEVGRAFNVF